MKRIATACSLFAISTAIACGGNTGELADEGDSEALSETQCIDLIQARVIAKAAKINDTAAVISTLRLYGSADSQAEATLVRVSDETDPSDYVVVRSRLKGNKVVPTQCSIKKVAQLADGQTPADDNLTAAFDKKCGAAVQKAAKGAAGASSKSSILESRLVYGGFGFVDGGGASVVRIADKGSLKDVFVGYSSLCKIEIAEVMNKGANLASLASLTSADTSHAFCIAPDGRSVGIGDSFKLDCNTCTCNEGGFTACTELACATGNTCTTPEGQTINVGDSFKLDCNTCTCNPGGYYACTELACH